MKGNLKKVIAIDGPSGAGKSTIARLIAKEIGFDYLDTGALYRAVALALRNSGIKPEDGDDQLREVLNNTAIIFKNGRIFLNNSDVSEDIRSKEIDHLSSVFSTKKIVRDCLLDAQRNTAFTTNIVVEGRDITTVVFPDAWKKIYLDASMEERAKRRSHQFRERGIEMSIEESIKNIMERDMRDSRRDIAPLKKPEGALLIDSSDLSIGLVKEKILEFIRADPLVTQ